MKLDEIGYNYKTGVLVSVVSTAASLQHTQGQSSHVSVWRIYVFFLFIWVSSAPVRFDKLIPETCQRSVLGTVETAHMYHWECVFVNFVIDWSCVPLVSALNPVHPEKTPA